MIAGGTIQLMIPDTLEHLVRTRLANQGKRLHSNADAFPPPVVTTKSLAESASLTASRVAFLCTRSRSREFQETALEGASARMRDAILQEYRRLVKDEAALLGHVGRPYWKGKGAVPADADMEMHGDDADNGATEAGESLAERSLFLEGDGVDTDMFGDGPDAPTTGATGRDSIRAASHV